MKQRVELCYAGPYDYESLAEVVAGKYANQLSGWFSGCLPRCSGFHTRLLETDALALQLSSDISTTSTGVHATAFSPQLDLMILSCMQNMKTLGIRKPPLRWSLPNSAELQRVLKQHSTMGMEWYDGYVANARGRPMHLGHAADAIADGQTARVSASFFCRCMRINDPVLRERNMDTVVDPRASSPMANQHAPLLVKERISVVREALWGKVVHLPWTRYPEREEARMADPLVTWRPVVVEDRTPALLVRFLAY